MKAPYSNYTMKRFQLHCLIKRIYATLDANKGYSVCKSDDPEREIVRGYEDIAVNYSHVVMPCHILVVGNSGNRFTGNILQCYSSKRTCPKSCAMLQSGACASQYDFTGLQWRRTDKIDLPFPLNYEVGNNVATDLYQYYDYLLLGALKQIKILVQKGEPITVPYRINVGGDLAQVDSDMIDSRLVLTHCGVINTVNCTLEALGFGADVIKAYTYTHCKQHRYNDISIRDMERAAGIVTNYSCELPSQVSSAIRAGINAVIVSTDVFETRRILKEEYGISSCQCANQTRDVTCKECGLCRKPNRGYAIVFNAHGRASKRVQDAIDITKQRIAFKAIIER